MLQQIFNGLAIGGVYILMALGLTMIYGVLRVLHFAHGLVVVTGAYVGWRIISIHQLPFGVALIAAMLGAGLLGVAIERIAYRPLGDVPPLIILITGVGLAIMGEDILNHVASPERQPVPVPTEAFWDLGVLTISGVQIIVLSITLGLLIGLAVLINATRTGLAIKATANDREISALMGVNVHQITSITFFIGSAFAGAAGLLVAMSYNAFYPGLGTIAAEKAFAVVVMGGLGSFTGTVIAGLALGLAEALIIGYFSLPIERDAIAFVVLIAMLMLRPTGIVNTTFKL